MKLLLEAVAEIGHVQKSHLIGYFGNVVVPGLKQFSGVFESDGTYEDAG